MTSVFNSTIYCPLLKIKVLQLTCSQNLPRVKRRQTKKNSLRKMQCRCHVTDCLLGHHMGSVQLWEPFN